MRWGEVEQGPQQRRCLQVPRNAVMLMEHATVAAESTDIVDE